MIQRKHLTVTGSTLRGRPRRSRRREIVAALKEKVWPLWAQGKLRTVHLQDVPARRGRGGASR